MQILGQAWLAVLQLVLCLVVLWKVCDIMVEGISSLSDRFRIPRAFAGATLAAVGSSAPEFGTSLFAILITKQGSFPDIGFGMILGSLIFNVCAVIGLAALFRNLKVPPRVYSRDAVFCAFSVLLLALALFDGRIDTAESALALVLYAAYSLVRDRARPEEAPALAPSAMPAWLSLLYFLGGAAIVAVACHLLVDAAADIGRKLTVPRTLLGLLVLAAGTSVPDCFAAIAAAKRGDGAMAISSALGSNIFDILVCLGLPVFVLNAQGHPYSIGTEHGLADPRGRAMLIVSLLYLFATLAIALVVLRHRREVGRKKGFLLLSLYLAYCVLIACASCTGPWISRLPEALRFGG
jgi:cation:H+ antiporter